MIYNIRVSGKRDFSFHSNVDAESLEEAKIKSLKQLFRRGEVDIKTSNEQNNLFDYVDETMQESFFIEQEPIEAERFLGAAIPFGVTLCADCVPLDWESEDSDYREIIDEGFTCNSCGKEIK